MKNKLNLALFALVVALPFAANAADASSQPATGNPGIQSPASVPDVAKFDEQLAKVREDMQKMQEQMNQIGQTQDSAERQKLLQDHWTSMQNAMQDMHGMWGAGCCANGMMGGQHMMGNMMDDDMMDGDMMGWDNMGGYYSNLTPDQIRQRQYMMDQYVPMQQMMMNNMMMHQNWMMRQQR